MPGRHRAGKRPPSHARTRSGRPPAWALTSCALVATGGVGAALFFSLGPETSDTGRPAAVSRPTVSVLPTSDTVPPTTHAPAARATPRPVPATRATTTPRATETPHTAKAKLPKSLAKRVRAAAAYAADHGLDCGIGVLDTSTGRYVGGGDDQDEFGSASVMKVFIAARLLAEPSRSSASKADLTEMVSRSDDGAANRYWGAAGGTGLVDWVEDRYDLDGSDDLGSANTIPGRWGNTHVTARGLVHFYAAMAKDDEVGPTLLKAMGNYTHYAVDGTDQHFGLADADGDPEVKQGWASYSADTNGNATVHSTGLVDDGRFAVAILTEGHGNARYNDVRSMNVAQREVVDHMSRLLMPSGRIDPADAN